MSRIVKKAVDTVNQQLLGPAQYPGAEEDYPLFDAFKGTEPEQIKTGNRQAMVKQHESPKHLPPRNDIRRHLDEELSDEIADEKAKDMHRDASFYLTAVQQRVWNRTAEHALFAGATDKKAMALADAAVSQRWKPNK